MSKAIRLEPWLKKLGMNGERITQEKLGFTRTESEIENTISQSWTEMRKAFNEATENDQSFKKK